MTRPLSLFGDGQQALPGVEPTNDDVPRLRPLPGGRDPGDTGPSQIPLMVPVRDLDGSPPGHSQLVLDSDQMELSAMEPEPAQLSMLAEPPVWELEAPKAPRTRKGRLQRKRAREGVPPGQTQLF